MTTELSQIVAMGSGGALFALGGYRIKALRRFVLPLLLALLVAHAGYPWWTCAAFGYFLARAFHLGYGESHPWFWKFFVGIEYAMATLLLGPTWWQLLLPVCWISLFLLSNTKAFAPQVPWKVVEFLTGTLIGVIVAVRLAAR